MQLATVRHIGIRLAPLKSVKAVPIAEDPSGANVAVGFYAGGSQTRIASTYFDDSPVRGRLFRTCCFVCESISRALTTAHRSCGSMVNNRVRFHILWSCRFGHCAAQYERRPCWTHGDAKHVFEHALRKSTCLRGY